MQNLISDINVLPQTKNQERHRNMVVSEIFYSVQGEGVSVGVPCYFIRLAGCNLECGGKGTLQDGELHNNATWRCDSMEVWKKGQSMSYTEIFDRMGEEADVMRNLADGAHIVLTGGEPLLQQEKIRNFLDSLYLHYALYCNQEGIKNQNSIYVEVETNGTVVPGPALTLQPSIPISQWNVSPKLANSGEPAPRRIRDHAMLELRKLGAYFKFVVSDQEDFLQCITDYIGPFNIPHNKILLMPAADNNADLINASKVVAEMCIANAIRFSPRLHIHIWDRATGV